MKNAIAFPFVEYPDAKRTNFGMYLRDYFAAHALVIMSDYCEDVPAEPIAERAYQIADAMIAERDK